MLAIPLDKQDSTTISELYGNAPYFALLDGQTGAFRVVENVQKGNGPKSAEFLNDLGISSTIFFHMGEGVYKAFEQKCIDVYTSHKSEFTLEEIYRGFKNSKLTKLTSLNYSELLDSGSTDCSCGCEN
ncbi:MAG: NifB/NifX family molybdenum-iron cluster-binding protein [Campylobacterota bacterium]|nr:NifB/NifX family molybdenum-iron cluster-binding protein [Campylobacterota bacterium]